jgi:tetratricopeptide (TPR) repeat protein
VLIIDVHAHITSPDEKRYQPKDRPLRPPGGKGSLEDLRRESLAHGVQAVRAVQTVSFYGYDNRAAFERRPAADRWAETLLRRAGARRSMGRYQLKAALQSAHVSRRRTGQANWAEVVQLYDALSALTGSPVVAINRALAIAELEGATVALKALEEAAADVRLAQHQPYWAARAELLAKVGAYGEARHAYEIAIGLERDPAVRRFEPISAPR